MNNDFEPSISQTIHSFKELPTIKALRAMQNSPAMRAIQNSPAIKALRAIQNSPAMEAMRAIQNSPAMEAMRAIQNAPAMEVMKDLEEALAIKTVQASQKTSALDTLSNVSNQINRDYSALELLKAYNLLVKEYKKKTTNEDGQPLDDLAKATKAKTNQASFSYPSPEFYLSLIITLILFFLSNAESKTSEELLLARADSLEQTLVTRLNKSESKQQEQIYLVPEQAVALRMGPSLKHDVFDVLLHKQVVIQLEVSDEWVRVEYIDNATSQIRRGWAYSSHFTVISRAYD